MGLQSVPGDVQTSEGGGSGGSHLSTARQTPRARPWLAWGSVALVAGLSSCTAIVDGESGAGPSPSATGSAEPGRPGEAGSTSAAPQALADVEAPAVAVPFRQLTRQEYQQTVHDLLGVEVDVAERLPPESPTGLFTRNAFDRNMNEQAVTAFQDVAHDLAKAR